jgi:hypothetical protein
MKYQHSMMPRQSLALKMMPSEWLKPREREREREGAAAKD